MTTVKTYTDAAEALEAIQQQIGKASDESRDGDADKLREVEAFLVNLINGEAK